MKTVYKLKEICKWSRGAPHIEHRYVDVTTVYTNTVGDQVTLSHTLELPADEAIRLCNAMQTEPTPVPTATATQNNNSTIIASMFVRQWIERTCRVKHNQEGEPIVYDLSCPSIPVTDVWRRNRKWVLTWLETREPDTVQTNANLGWTISFNAWAPEAMFVPVNAANDGLENL